MIVAALFFSLITFVPLDDRPVTRRLPELLGRIAGERVQEPPLQLLGNYLTPGDPDAIARWLNGPAPRASSAFVLSTDMLAYGGLVASRTPATSYADAYFRLGELHQLRSEYPGAWIGAFGTIMRLAPTGVPAVGGASQFFAAYPVWHYLQEYADLHDPPLPSETARAQRLRALAGAALPEYLAARQRNYGIDLRAIEMTNGGAIDSLVVGQDDAGAVGLHVRDVRALRNAVAARGLGDRVAIEPGADELGMALVAHALARAAGWTPRVSVHYSTPDGAAYSDPLEYAPVDTAIGSLIALCGGVRVQGTADVELYVRVPGTRRTQDDALAEAMRSAEDRGGSVAFADLTFLENTYGDQARFAREILADGIAGKLDSYASWNTNANTVGTALAEAVAAGAGRRRGTYDDLAHREFTFDRFVDDYAFHDLVRPQLNAALDAQGIADHTYLLPEQAKSTAALNEALLWNDAASILPQLYPGYHIAAMQITLPWSRTFETSIEASIAPNI
jgi:hypothetical protein